jgi:hypothetical protein
MGEEQEEMKLLPHVQDNVGIKKLRDIIYINAGVKDFLYCLCFIM